MTIDRQALERQIQEIGTEIYQEVQASTLSVFDPEFYTGKLMDWSMQDEEFKISLFRFVDVFPGLQDSSAIVRHAQEYFEPVADRIPGLVKWGLKVDPSSISAKVAAPIISHQIRSMAERFIVGETPKDALKSLRRIRKEGMSFTVDLLGEATLGEPESDEYLRRYLELLDVLATEVPKWRESQPIVAGHKGERTAINISVKLSALYSQAKPLSAERSVEVLSERLAQILHKAKSVGAYVFVDMEDTSFVDITLDTVKRALSFPDLCDYDQCGFVMQAYLRRTERDIDQLIEWIRARGVRVGVRLVKGAYWDTEAISAKQKGWAVPVWEKKSSTDACYERIALKLLKNADILLPAFASHNLRTLSFVASAAKLYGVEPTDFEMQALYGMAEPIKKAFARRGYLIREYAPIGELIPGMSYLVRRLLENTSNEGFLRQTFREHEKPEILLASPIADEEDTGTRHLSYEIREKFTNVEPLDFSIPEERARFNQILQALVARVRSQPIVAKPIVSGKLIDSNSAANSISPENTSLTLGRIEYADAQLTERAVADLADYFPTWRGLGFGPRAEILFRAAELMIKRRYDLSALIVLEAGKPWAEADADVCEAIDFLVYYGHEARKLGGVRRMGDYPGEYNTYFYEPRGVTAVICPWNFPLAIPCGMFAAALVTGNCAVLKPAEQTTLIAQELFEIFREAGLPERAASFLPGIGEVMGAALTKHPKVSTIVFTGSKEVGLKIIQESGATLPSFDHVKRVIAEMGGKNAIIVDDDADIDEAIKGIVYSAFAFQGQKCSACSRLILVDSVYDRLVPRLKEAVSALTHGPASASSTFVGPVIDSEAFTRIRSVIENAKRDCKLLVEGGEPSGDLTKGYFIRPTVFYDVPAGHELLTREIFGPVMAIVRAKNFDDALDIACSIEYRLTGGVYSRSPRNIEKAVEQFRVGNLYINRGCTGALVYRQPFGGAHMSGVGSKAGGPDYLLQFVVPRSVSENTMRRGFAPKID